MCVPHYGVVVECVQDGSEDTDPGRVLLAVVVPGGGLDVGVADHLLATVVAQLEVVVHLDTQVHALYTCFTRAHRYM